MTMTESARETESHPDRRRFLKWVIRLGTGAFVLAFALPALALKTLTTQQEKIAGGEPLVYATGDRSGTPVKAVDIPVKGAAQAFPQGKSDDQNNLVELVRIAE